MILINRWLCRSTISDKRVASPYDDSRQLMAWSRLREMSRRSAWALDFLVGVMLGKDPYSFVRLCTVSAAER